MELKEIIIKTVNILNEKKANDICVYEIGEKSGFADYLLVCTGNNLRQVGALCDELEDKLAEIGVVFKSVEGRNDSGWILLDYGDFIINIFTPEQRNHYNIDRLWNDCIKLDINFENKVGE